MCIVGYKPIKKNENKKKLKLASTTIRKKMTESQKKVSEPRSSGTRNARSNSNSKAAGTMKKRTALNRTSSLFRMTPMQKTSNLK